ncbi:MAG TPA: GTP 3',8-cyclase MoaA [Herpetosiphonaceae bacterium]
MASVPITLVDQPAGAPGLADQAAGAPALDSYGRRINYLRVSLTDRCNFRCFYCMPEHGLQFAPPAEFLSNDELRRVIRVMAGAGFEKIRLTGGEPTLRKDLVGLVRDIAATPGITDVSMTTNGLRLDRLAAPLAEAGLKRVNVSIDSLDADKFRRITRGGDLARVWAGIEAAEAAGLAPLKLNCVVVRGYNDDEIVELARLTVDRPWQMRFIEVMPLVGVAGVADGGVVPSAELIAKIEAAEGLEWVGWFGADPARTYRIPGAKGTLGFISSVSDPFCSTCNRMRLTADGKLHLCLLRDNELDLRGPLRAGIDDAGLEALVREAVFAKPWGHGLPDGVRPTLRGMSQLGG